ncbi:MAG: polyprenyl diphosphate synthase [Clostridia bacterium]
MFKWLKRRKTEQKIDTNNLPSHIGFIMDGNGRWAKKRGLPRSAGHRAGVDALKKVVGYCFDIGVETVSLFALSTENLQRPKQEVDYIFKLIKEFASECVTLLGKRNARLMLMGDIKLLPDDVRDVFLDAVEKTKNNSSHVLNLGLCYGARYEICEAVNNIIKDGITKVDESLLSSYLYTGGQKDPDLIVRSSGEQRLSNFMLYQSAYAELYFPNKHWPDFDEFEVDQAIIAYQSRERRFGKVK